jgi:hypothetical protein
MEAPVPSAATAGDNAPEHSKPAVAHIRENLGIGFLHSFLPRKRRTLYAVNARVASIGNARILPLGRQDRSRS